MTMPDETCVRCGHVMSWPKCGRSGTPLGPMCHTDDHSCYKEYLWERTLEMLRR